MIYICEPAITPRYNIMNKMWKKLAEMLVLSIVPVLIEMAIEELSKLKKKLEEKEGKS